MSHLTDGTVRRLVDEPAGVAQAAREHAARCTTCEAALAEAAEDAAFAEAALGPEPGTTDVDAGWARLSSAAAAGARPRGAERTRRPRWRSALRSPVVAGVGVLAVVAGAGAAAAGDWLSIFSAEQVAPVTVTPADAAAMAELPDLSDYGTVEVVHDVDVHAVASAAAAEQATGLPVPQLGDLPRGVTGAPVYQVADRAVVVFTFSAEAAERAAAATGATPPPSPPGLDGGRFRLTAGPGVAVVWPGNSGVPALVAGRAVAPAAQSSGVGFETARDYLLSLPGLPDGVAAQLRALSGDPTTLPLVVDAEEAAATTADVGGTPATVLTSRDRTMAGVVWVDDGVLTAVAGSLSADEVLGIARGLR